MDAEFSQQLESLGGSSNLSYVYILSPVIAISCSLILTCAFVVMPIVGPRITSKYGQLKNDRTRFHTVLGSCTHHALVSTLAMYAFISGTISDPIIDQSALGYRLMQITFGYFVADLIIMLSDAKMRQMKLMIIHHIIGIMGYALSLMSEGKGMYFAVSFQMTELSNVFLSLSVAMITTGINKDSIYYKMNSIALKVSFFLTRILLIPWQWYKFILLLLDPASRIIPVAYKLFTFFFFLFIHSMFIYWFIFLLKKGTYLKKKST